MGDMGMPCFTANQHVINKYKDTMMNKGLKYFVCETLEGGRCIAKSKVGIHQKLKMSFMSAKISFRNVHFLHANWVIT
jgi:hypothetical protein